MSQVVIGDILPRTQLSATSGQTVFSTNWTADSASDVVVYYTPLGNPPNDAAQVLAYPAAYSVAFIGASQEVEVTLVTPAVNTGDIVTITRQTPADRLNLYTNTNFTPDMLNQDFGVLTLVDQQAQLVNQLIAPRYNYSADIIDIVDTILPILGANQTWVKNPSNTGFIAYTLPGGGFPGTGTVTQVNTGTGLSGGPITTTGTINLSVPVTLNHGGTNNASLTASAGGIVWSDATKLNILGGTSTAGLALLSGNGITPSWSTLPPITKINRVSFLTSGMHTYTPSVGLVYADVELIGGGGGGGGCAAATGADATATAGAASPGGAAGYTKKRLTAAQIGASQVVTIAVGGPGGAAGANNGSNGSTSSFGSLLLATGGRGGQGASTAINLAFLGGGVGGEGTLGDINTIGEGGEGSMSLGGTSQINYTGNGGSVYFGGGAPGEANGSAVGNPATSYGGGGGGALVVIGTPAAKAGGDGFVGACFITEYISI